MLPPPGLSPLTVRDTGSGTIDASVPDYHSLSHCTGDSVSCPWLYFPTQKVTYTATPTSGWTFGGWTGCDAVSGTQCMVTAADTTPRTVTAQFRNCTPGQARSCCAYAKGCGCRGEQTCSAIGLWGACEGSTPTGTSCQ